MPHNTPFPIPKDKESKVQVRLHLTEALLTLSKTNPNMEYEDVLAALEVLTILGVVSKNE